MSLMEKLVRNVYVNSYFICWGLLKHCFITSLYTVHLCSMNRTFYLLNLNTLKSIVCKWFYSSVVWNCYDKMYPRTLHTCDVLDLVAGYLSNPEIYFSGAGVQLLINLAESKFTKSHYLSSPFHFVPQVYTFPASYSALQLLNLTWSIPTPMQGGHIGFPILDSRG